MRDSPPGGYLSRSHAIALLAGAALLDACTTASITEVGDKTPPQITIDWDGGPWIARQGSLTVTASIADTGSGVASASLVVQLAAGGTAPVAGTLSTSGATFSVPGTVGRAGQADALSFQLTATDKAGNQTPPLSDATWPKLRIDDAPPTIAPTPPPGWADGGMVSLPVAVADQGSGVLGYQLIIGAVAMTGIAGQPFAIDTSLHTAPGFEGALPFRVVATDQVGNVADAGGTILVDRAPPGIVSFSAAANAASGDYTAPDGGVWFRAGAGSIASAAGIDGGAGSPIDSVTLTAASVPSGCSQVAGTSDVASPYRFAVPRCLGAGVEGTVTLRLNARDQAGNQVAPGVLAATGVSETLLFDDQAPSAALVSPTGWVSRKKAIGGATQEVVVRLVDNGSGVLGGLLQPTGGSSVTLTQLPDKTWLGSIGLVGAPAGVATAAYPALVTPTDHVGNSAGRQIALQVDDAAPVITADPNNPIYGNGSWHSAAGATLTLTVTAAITDSGSGVASAPNAPALRVGTAGTNPDATGSLQTGTAASGTWTFGAITLSSSNSIETNSYPLYIDAQDQAGNPAARATLTAQVDNRAPAYDPNAFAIAAATPPDGTDGQGRAWFKGASFYAAGQAPKVKLKAKVIEGYLKTATAKLPDASLVPGFCTANGDGTSDCSFLIPRPASSGAFAVTYDAQDQAGNLVATPNPVFTLRFDNDQAAVFTPAVDADAAWYRRDPALSMVVTASLPALPASGVAAVTLAVAGQTALAPASVSADLKTRAFNLPTTSAAAGTEQPLAFTVTATSVVGASAQVSGSRNVDDGAPQLTAAGVTILYPANDTSTAVSFSHDGGHFNLHDGTQAVLSFVAYDCGAGVASAASAQVSGSPPPGLAVNRIDNLDTSSCPGGAPAQNYKYTLSFDPSALPRSLLPQEDTALPITVTLGDLLGTPHLVTLSPSVNVTRRIWATQSSLGATQLAVGPRLLALALPAGNLYALDRTSGASSTWVSSGQVEAMAVGGTQAAPVAYWLSNPGMLSSAPADQVNPTPFTCSLVFANESHVADDGLIVRDSSSVLATTDSSPYAKVYDCGLCPAGPTFDSCVNNCEGLSLCGPCPGAVGCARVSSYDTSVVCPSTTRRVSSLAASTCATVSFGPTGAVPYGSGGVHSGRLYSVANRTLSEMATTGGAVLTAPALPQASSGLVVSGSGAGDFVFFSSGTSTSERFDFSGTAFGGSAAATGFGWPLVTANDSGSLKTVSRLGGQFVVTDSSGTAQGSVAFAGGTVAPLVDAAGTAFLAGRGSANEVIGVPVASIASNVAVAGSAAHLFPAAVDDLVLDLGGVLYVASGGKVYAIQTDSPGLGTDPAGGANSIAWPARGRDACRSQNVSFACPW